MPIELKRPNFLLNSPTNFHKFHKIWPTSGVDSQSFGDGDAPPFRAADLPEEDVHLQQGEELKDRADLVREGVAAVEVNLH